MSANVPYCGCSQFRCRATRLGRLEAARRKACRKPRMPSVLILPGYGRAHQRPARETAEIEARSRLRTCPAGAGAPLTMRPYPRRRERARPAERANRNEDAASGERKRRTEERTSRTAHATVAAPPCLPSYCRGRDTQERLHPRSELPVSLRKYRFSLQRRQDAVRRTSDRAGGNGPHSRSASLRSYSNRATASICAAACPARRMSSGRGAVSSQAAGRPAAGSA